jgi:internalin A
MPPNLRLRSQQFATFRKCQGQRHLSLAPPRNVGRSIHNVPVKLSECGCGEPAPIAKKTQSSLGRVAWLRRIHLRAGDEARTLMVATHSGDREPELDYPHLEQAFPAILNGACAIDSRTGDGVAELRGAISSRAAELPQMGQLISPRWVAAREEILARAVGEPQMEYEKFTEVCERHGVAGAEVSTLAKQMHDLGLIMYFAEDEGLRDVVVLNPEWLTRAISYVLEDQPTWRARGVLDHARLKAIWHDRQDGYDTRYHRYFLRLMEKFDISYRLDSDHLHSLVAQMVPHQRSALPWQGGTDLEEGTRACG